MKLLLPALLLLAALGPVRVVAAPYAQRWVYCSQNLSVDKSVEELEAIFQRAGRAGYTHVMLADYKSGFLQEMPAHYFQNVERVKRSALANKLEIVPAVFPIGYSNSLLVNDVNLAEGLPVREAPFVVQSGAARLMPDPGAVLKGDDFQSFAGWAMHDDLLVLENGSVRMTDPHGHNARVMQPVKVHPFRQYHLSVEVKTQDLKGAMPEVKLLAAGDFELSYSDLGVKRTNDWKLCHVVFNSLEYEKVNVYLGCWGAMTGTVQWRHPKLEEVGLVNLIRRDGAPLEVKTEDGKLLVEGKDFEPLKDPKMGQVPYNGSYDVYHEPPVIRTALPDGTKLRVSYSHVVTIGDGQVNISVSEPKTIALLRDQAKRMHAAWGAKGYFMSHDEIRVMGWDKISMDRHLDAGALLADNVKTCTEILHEVNPGGDVYVWSDMFDPTHNARKGYYLVRGDLTGSWKGLDKSVKVMLWNHGARVAGLKFFGELGNPMLIAGYYDAPVEQVRDWLEAAKPYSRVEGVMYTTWENNYSDLEKFATELGGAK